MRIVVTVLLFTSIKFLACSQMISGKIVNEANGNPLEFVSVGVISLNIGTVSDEKGFFNIDLKDVSPTAQVRVSMIGFVAQTFSVKDLLKKDNLVRLNEQVIDLNEVVVKASQTKRKVLGTKSSTRFIVTGWGGYGTGGERGIKIEVNSQPIFVEKLNFHVAVNTFDSLLLRLHIRNIKNGVPKNELLPDNILTKVISTGWFEINLEKYNLSYNQDIAVSLEWVKAWGKKKGLENNFLLSLNYFKGTLYGKEASEANWSVFKHKSPGIYLTIQE